MQPRFEHFVWRSWRTHCFSWHDIYTCYTSYCVCEHAHGESDAVFIVQADVWKNFFNVDWIQMESCASWWRVYSVMTPVSIDASRIYFKAGGQKRNNSNLKQFTKSLASRTHCFSLVGYTQCDRLLQYKPRSWFAAHPLEVRLRLPLWWRPKSLYSEAPISPQLWVPSYQHHPVWK